MHPVFVAAQGVDFAVVAHHADRLSAVPRGESVGGEAGVDQGHVGLEVGALQILVIGDHLYKKKTQVETGDDERMNFQNKKNERQEQGKKGSRSKLVRDLSTTKKRRETPGQRIRKRRETRPHKLRNQVIVKLYGVLFRSPGPGSAGPCT